MTVDFIFDVVCPFAYLASTRVEEVAARAGATVRWVPVLLGGIFRAIGGDDDPNAIMAVPKARLHARDLLRQAERLGVPLRPNPRHPQRSVEAMRLLCAAPPERVPALAADLFRAYHVQGGDLDRAALASHAARHGVDLARIDDDDVKARLRANTDDAVARGAFGVPTFLVGDTLVYGVDHLPELARVLGTSWAVPPRAPDGVARTVTFFHDFASPWSYLGAPQVDAVAARAGGVVERVPMLLGALFQQIGTPTVPIQALTPPRRAHVGRSLLRWADHLGVPFRWPSTFPLRTVTPLRVALLAPDATGPLYRAAWADDRDIGRDEVLAEVLDEAGFDAAGLLEGARDPAVKARLVDTTARAVAAGVCGAPSFQVGDVLFWGQDRLDMVADALGGWVPAAG